MITICELTGGCKVTFGRYTNDKMERHNRTRTVPSSRVRWRAGLLTRAATHRIPREMAVTGGLEPSTCSLTGSRSSELSYVTLAVSTGFEPVVSALTGQRIRPGYATRPGSLNKEMSGDRTERAPDAHYTHADHSSQGKKWCPPRDCALGAGGEPCIINVRW